MSKEIALRKHERLARRAESLGIVSLAGAEVWMPGEKCAAEIPVAAGLRAWRDMTCLW
jgi:hypothetical protein